ncbi:uncharacterized protein KGF55_005215 [Candida pseudojiufengensis]|uniref:uncharacterized protein n=1 Tax=Candida pseudojiufengensis TaxID=497109 RepID=UPI0022249402|nr:uncharacterized protein KGF55_005215 [Candida pseudojiufengensis]KAI5959571.1 hypothetical protein KGF55_005215 [Candida pseudojiufengensis]
MRSREVKKQLLSPLDIPQTVPSLNLNNLNHAVDTFTPSFYDLNDLPNLIPIYNNDGGKKKKYIKRRIVSAPPVVGNFSLDVNSNKIEKKDLPAIPSIGAYNERSLLQPKVKPYRDFSMPVNTNSCSDHYYQQTLDPKIYTEETTNTSYKSSSKDILDPTRLSSSISNGTNHQIPSTRTTAIQSLGSSNYSLLDSLTSKDAQHSSMKESPVIHPETKVLPKARTKKQTFYTQPNALKAILPENYYSTSSRIYSESRFPRTVVNPNKFHHESTRATSKLQSRAVSDQINEQSTKYALPIANSIQRPNSVEMKRHISAFIGRWKTKEIEKNSHEGNVSKAKELPRIPSHYERENRFGNRQLYT